MKQRILVTDNVQLGPTHIYDDVDIDNQAGIARDALLKIVGDYEAIITRSRTQVDGDLLNAASQL